MELATKAHTVKTFDNQIYKLKGSLAVNEDNGEIEKVADIYYRVRTAINEDHGIVAKRKHDEDELQSWKKKVFNSE